MGERQVSGEEHAAMVSSRPPVKPSYNRIALAVAGALVLCGLSFYGGVQYQKGHTAASNTSAQGPVAGRFGRRSGGLGQVTSVSAGSITISNQRTGASETFNITSTTSVTNNGQSATVADIKSGDTVLIMTSGSGSKDATRIMINPSFGGGFGGNAPSASPPTQGSSTTQGSATTLTN